MVMGLWLWTCPECDGAGQACEWVVDHPVASDAAVVVCGCCEGSGQVDDSVLRRHLRALRKSYGMSAAAASLALGWPVTRCHRLECGADGISVQRIVRYRFGDHRRGWPSVRAALEAASASEPSTLKPGGVLEAYERMLAEREEVAS